MTEIKIQSAKGISGIDFEAISTRRGMEISFNRINSVEEFSSTKIILKLKRGFVLINGEDMNIVLFESKKLEVRGNVTELCFLNNPEETEKSTNAH